MPRSTLVFKRFNILFVQPDPFYTFSPLRDSLGLATRDISVYLDCKLLVLELISVVFVDLHRSTKRLPRLRIFLTDTMPTE